MLRWLTALVHLFKRQSPAPNQAVVPVTPTPAPARKPKAKVPVARPAPVVVIQRPGNLQVAPQPGPRPAERRNPDRIGIVGFHEHGFVIARPAEPFAPWLVERSQSLHRKLGGRTNMADGLRYALQLLTDTPRGVYRRIWLLSDGEPNVDVDSLGPLVDACYQAHININTIGFGNAFNEGLLRRIASATHRGRFIPVQSLRELTAALSQADIPTGNYGRRSETTILAIDCSYSMAEPMEGRQKIAVVEEAILHLLHYKQRLFA